MEAIAEASLGRRLLGAGEPEGAAAATADADDTDKADGEEEDEERDDEVAAAPPTDERDCEIAIPPTTDARGASEGEPAADKDEVDDANADDREFFSSFSMSRDNDSVEEKTRPYQHENLGTVGKTRCTMSAAVPDLRLKKLRSAVISSRALIAAAFARRKGRAELNVERDQ
jgi:hypothetical protein